MLERVDVELVDVPDVELVVCVRELEEVTEVLLEVDVKLPQDPRVVVTTIKQPRCFPPYCKSEEAKG